MANVLDLYCGVGGATHGYQLAGYRVTGVDIHEQPNYCGDMFIRSDAITYVKEYGHKYDFIHASPPCQAYSILNHYNHKEYPDLVAETRHALVATGTPYVIENVPQAPLSRETSITLCGRMLGVSVYRHRLFEPGNGTSLKQPDHHRHDKLCARNGYLPTVERPFMTISGGKHSKAWQQAAAQCMGVGWARTITEVCEAIPPAYTLWVARNGGTYG